MPSRSSHLCPRCRRIVPPGPCAYCTPITQHDSDARRGSSAERGYDHAWREHVRLPFLAEHPLCCLCGALAEVPDHHPHTRRELLAMQVEDVDAWHRLRPLCLSCHGRHGRR